jgi:hypothetical protein
MLPLPRASPHDDAGRLCVTTQTLFWCADPNPVRAWRRAKEKKKPSEGAKHSIQSIEKQWQNRRAVSRGI